MMTELKKTVRDFDASYELWKNALIGEDRNTLRRQFIQLGWKISFYNSIKNHATLCEIDDEGRSKHCHALEAFISENFYEAISISLRRAILDNYDISDKKRSVFSIKSLVNDIKYNSGAIKRGVLKEKIKENIKQESTDDEEMLINDLNLTFDFFSKKTKENRSDDDQICESVLTKISEILCRHENFDIKINKNVAHSAHPDNRIFKPVKVGDIDLHLEDYIINIEEVNSLFFDGWRIYSLLKRLFLYSDSGFISDFGKFFYENIDKPFVTTENIKRMKEQWNDFEKKNRIFEFTFNDLLE